MDGSCSQSEEWVITPPDSPKLEEIMEFINDTDTEDRVISLPDLKFFCMGQCNVSDSSFHKSSIYTTLYQKEFDVLNSFDAKTNAQIYLFDRTYDFWSVLDEHMEEIFNLCRKDFMKLHNTINENLTASRSSNKSHFSKLRDNICIFFNYLYFYINSCYLHVKKTDSLRRILPKLKTNLSDLWLLIGRLGFETIPDYILAHYCSNCGENTSLPSFHLIHCYLDVRWFYIKILQTLQKEERVTSYDNVSSQIVVLSNETTCIDDKVQFILHELVLLSSCRFERADNLELSGFNCVCVKEFWLTMIIELDTSDKNNFWHYFNHLLNNILKTTELTIPTVNCKKLNNPNFGTCSKSPEFCLWLLNNIAKLYKYKNSEIVANYELLEDIMKCYLKTEPNEVSLRKCLPIVLSILRLWRYSKHEPVLLLWEFYHKKLNSAFYVPGSKLDTCAVNSKTGQNLLEQVKTRVTSYQDSSDNNSYSMFLKILGTHLSKCKESNIQHHKITSRILIKLAPSKLSELSEFGLYHMSSLFLTVAFVTDTKTMTCKLHHLLSQYPLEKLNTNKLSVMWKAHTAAVLLMLEQNLNVEENINYLTAELDRLLFTQDNNSSTCLTTFIDSFKHIISNSNLKLSQFIILNKWIVKFVKLFTSSDVLKMFSTILMVIQRLRQFVNTSRVNDSQIQDIRSELTKDVLPQLQMIESVPAAAELAAEYTLLYQTCASSVELNQMYDKWTGVDNIQLTRRYLTHLLTNTNLVELSQYVRHFEDSLIQCWIKCYIFTGDEFGPEMKQLTTHVSQLSFLQQLKNDTGRCLEQSVDPLHEFIVACKQTYNNSKNFCQKSAIRDKFLQYFSRIDKYMSAELKITEANVSNTAIINKIYKYLGLLFKECYNLIYTRSHPRSVLKQAVDLLLLPPSIFKSDYTPPCCVLDSIKTYLSFFIDGLFGLGPESDPFINRTLRDIVVHYVPRLTNSLSGTNKTNHPLIEQFTVGNRARFILDVIISQFLVVKGRIPHASCLKALSMLDEVLSANNEDIFKIVLDLYTPALLDFVMLCEESNAARQRGLNILKNIVHSPCFIEESYGQSLSEMLKTSCRKHLAFNSLVWFKLALHLISICPQIVEDVLPTLEIEIEGVERRRGVERDAGLRKSMEHLCKLLSTSGNQQLYL